MRDTDRLGRLVDAEGDGGTLDDRLAELDDLDARASAGTEADLDRLNALANPTRYHLVRLLAEDGELTVAELDAVVAVSQSAVSHALSTLADAGLVERRRDGTWRYYRATDDAERLVAALAEMRG